jgi:hypothetical protein
MSQTRFVHGAKTFLPFVPESSAEFSALPEFSGGVWKKLLSTGWAWTFDLQIMKQIFYHCAIASLWIWCYGIHCVPCWDFPTVSVVTGSRFSGCICSYLPGFSGRICSYWQPDAVSVVICRNFLALTFPARECKKSPFRDQKAGISQQHLLFLAGIFQL